MRGFLKKVVAFLIDNWLIWLVITGAVAIGFLFSPFDLGLPTIEDRRVKLDALPKVGENQQIVYVRWGTTSPQTMNNYIVYPLSGYLLGISGVKKLRTITIPGISFFFLIFDEDIDFYYARARVNEKISSMPAGMLPSGASISLGPEATAVGQIMYYFLEGEEFSPSELTAINDFWIRPLLNSVKGVAEVSSLGGLAREIKVRLDPGLLQVYKILPQDIIKTIEENNKEETPSTYEFNKVEYLLVVKGLLHNAQEISELPIKTVNDKVIRIKDIGFVVEGPAPRMGGLEYNGKDVIGGVIVVSAKADPFSTIKKVKQKIQEIENLLPYKEINGEKHKVSIKVFYDRSAFIEFVIRFIRDTLISQIAITVIVLIFFIKDLIACLAISLVLPFSLLPTFSIMSFFDIPMNLMSAAGISISIGVLVDAGVIFIENVVSAREKGVPLRKAVINAPKEVGTALLTSFSTTLVSFLPVYSFSGYEGQIFKPMVILKTIVILLGLIISFLITLPLYYFLQKIIQNKISQFLLLLGSLVMSILLFINQEIIGGVFLLIILASFLLKRFAYLSNQFSTLKSRFFTVVSRIEQFQTILIFIFSCYLLSKIWKLTYTNELINLLIIMGLIVFIMIPSVAMWIFYKKIAQITFSHKLTFFTLLTCVIIAGIYAFTRFQPELLPSLREGTFLFMPTIQPSASIEEIKECARKVNEQIKQIPEVDFVVGKWGRAESALDPAPTYMYESIIQQKPEFKIDTQGKIIKWKVDKDGCFVLKNGKKYNPQKDPFTIIPDSLLIPDNNGKPFRQWRPHIKTERDIWTEISKVIDYPGLVPPPMLGPIETRVIMLETGVKGKTALVVNAKSTEDAYIASLHLEDALKKVPSINPSTVFAERYLSKPFIDIIPNRILLARYNISIDELINQLTMHFGGLPVSQQILGRERYTIRLIISSDITSPLNIENLIIFASNGKQVKLKEIADIQVSISSEMLRTENSFPSGYITFDVNPGYSYIYAVNQAKELINTMIKEGTLKLPSQTTFYFTGTYEHYVSAMKTLAFVLPISVLAILFILNIHFGNFILALIPFSGIIIGFSGAFLFILLFSPEIINKLPFIGYLFNIWDIKISVATWLGLIVLFGIITDDGVLILTYIRDLFKEKKPQNTSQIKEVIIEAGTKRVRPAMMTTVTALISLLPVLTSTEKGSEILIPISLPVFGGMLIEIITSLTVPALTLLLFEIRLLKKL